MSHHTRFGIGGSPRLAASAAAASLSERVRRAHRTAQHLRPLQLTWRRAVRGRAAVRIFTRQVVSVTVSPRINLQFSFATSEGRSDVPRAVQSDTSTTHRHVQSVWRRGQTDRHVQRFSTRVQTNRHLEMFWRHTQTNLPAHSFGTLVQASRNEQRFWRHVTTNVESRLLSREVRLGAGDLAASSTSSPSWQAVDAALRRITWQSRLRVGARLQPRFRAASLAFLDGQTDGALTAHIVQRVLRSKNRFQVRALRRHALHVPSDPSVVRGAVAKDFAGASRPVAHRPVDLTWRRPSTAAEATSRSTPIDERVGERSSARQALAPQRIVPDITRSAVQTNQARPFSLDASQLDRLTDDVIRRVDRRVRIARERRGL